MRTGDGGCGAPPPSSRAVSLTRRAAERSAAPPSPLSAAARGAARLQRAAGLHAQAVQCAPCRRRSPLQRRQRCARGAPPGQGLRVGSGAVQSAGPQAQARSCAPATCAPRRVASGAWHSQAATQPLEAGGPGGDGRPRNAASRLRAHLDPAAAALPAAVLQARRELGGGSTAPSRGRLDPPSVARSPRSTAPGR